MRFGELLALSLRVSARDWRSAEVRLLALCLALAVAALASVGLFIDRAQRALQRDAAIFLGADLALESDSPIDPAIAGQAREHGLQVAETVTFPSMVIGERDADRSVLAAVKAVSADYPLRGSVSLRDGSGQRAVASGPKAGSAWVDPQIQDALGVDAGDTLRLGESRFRLAGVIATEPDRGASWASFAPRIMIGLPDLAATELIRPASRVHRHLLIAGADAAVQEFSAWLRPRLARGQRLQSLQEGRPDLHEALERARRFLTLVALLAALLAAVAVASAAHRFSLKRIDTCGVLRCLGLTGGQLLAMFSIEFLILGLSASAAGAIAGFGLHHVLVALLAGLLPSALPPASPLPLMQAIACGLTLLAGFGLPPVVRLRRVSALQVLRRDLRRVPDRPTAAVWAIGASAYMALLFWLAGDPRLALVTGFGFGAAGLVFAILAWGILRALNSLRRNGPGFPASLSFALAGLARRSESSIVQVTALAVGMCALLLMAVVQSDLLRQWQAQVPADAPNRFIINIQPDQADAVASRLRAAGIEAGLRPMVRGRLVQINGRPLDAERLEGERARALAEREFNLSYAGSTPEDNEIVQGRWFAADAAELSIEEGIAHTLGVHLGDRLCFDIAGQPVCAIATSLRRLRWNSMKVNFFVIMPPSLLEQQPRTLITAIHVASDAADPTRALVHEFRNLTVIDTGAVLSQLRALLEQLSRAVQFVVLFALLAGVLVLYAALSSSQDERAHEAALLRTFGATRGRLWRAQSVELALIGSIAGVLAAGGASAIAWLLAREALNFEFRLHPASLALGALLGAACALAGGALALRRVVATAPMRTLRAL